MENQITVGARVRVAGPGPPYGYVLALYPCAFTGAPLAAIGPTPGYPYGGEEVSVTLVTPA